MGPEDDRQRVVRFWQQRAARFGFASGAAVQAEPVHVSDRTRVFLVRDGDLVAAVRWSRGSLLAVDKAALEAARLFVLAAELGLAPRVLLWEQGALLLDRQPVVASDFITPGVPDVEWFHSNLQQVAALLARLHRDEDLGDLLESFQRGDRRADALAAARAAWANVQVRLADLGVAAWGPELRAVLDELTLYGAWFGSQIQRRLAAFQGVPVGPVHGDLNRYNWLVGGDNRVTLIDWERARLDDPALDVGMMLFWYVPRALWPIFARGYAGASPQAVDADALLERARIRYPLHAIDVCAWKLERLAGGQESDSGAALAFLEPFLRDLRQLRAGTFGAG
ncbi:MAG: phosphotransferase [Anaerolineae bacterium]|nr:phosphotransferase [Anaerolineae bacterium]